LTSLFECKVFFGSEAVRQTRVISSAASSAHSAVPTNVQSTEIWVWMAHLVGTTKLSEAYMRVELGYSS